MPETCPECKKTFTIRSNLRRHMKNHLDTALLSQFTCDHCGKAFHYKYNATRHILKCQVQQEADKQCEKVRCSLCPFKSTRKNVLEHYTSAHNIAISSEVITFRSLSEFESWKSTMENDTTSYFVKSKSTKLRSKVIRYYRCHRDGSFKSTGQNIRKLKVIGSNKINGYCPAKLDVTVLNSNGAVSVHFLQTHIGHKMDLNRIPLKKADRDFLARKIRDKVPFDEILRGVRADDGTNQRLRLITRKDLFNVEKLYSLEGSETPVDSWVQGLPGLRFYKGPGAGCKAYPALKPEDLLLVLVDDPQVLERYGSAAWCIDRVNALSKNEYEFVALMVSTPQGAHPCGFAFSNRSDHVIYSLLFDLLTGLLKSPPAPRLLLTDAKKCVHSGWLDVVGAPASTFYTPWSLLPHWRLVLAAKLKDQALQRNVQLRLQQLLEATDLEVFEAGLGALLGDPDPRLEAFKAYFAKQFGASKRTWALAHRDAAELEVVAQFEALHKDLLGVYEWNKTRKRFGEAVRTVLDFAAKSSLGQGPIEDGNVLIKESQGRDTDIALVELPICIATDGSVQMSDVQRYQCKLIQQFYSVVESVSTLGKCQYFEAALANIEKNLSAVQ